MLDKNSVSKSFDDVVARLSTRSGTLDLGTFKQLFTERRALNIELEQLSAERNAANEEMKKLAKSDPAALDARRAAMREVGDKIKAKEPRLKEVEAALDALLLILPNIPHASVPVGKSEADNKVERVWGEPPKLLFQARQHFEIGEKLKLLDFERAAKVSGSRFAFLKGNLARLERALITFMIDQHTARGYEEVLPPYLVNRAAMMGTGQLPKFEDDAFKTAGEQELFLIPTAEVPVTNYHQDEILEADELPKKYCAFSPCFRAEAGAAGRDTRGLIRMHQFHKVELVMFSRPDDSLKNLETLVADAASILEKLGLHHRVSLLCTGDMGFASQKTYDLEVWLPGQNAFREISSCSNFGDFQARRAKIRWRPAKGEKPQPLHTLNGSGLAVGRTLVAILENFQREDGSVVIPEALRPYMGGVGELKP